MDKWVKKLAKLGRSSAEIVGFVKTIPKTPLDDVPKDSSDSGKREKGNALQQSGNFGSGTAAFK